MSRLLRSRTLVLPVSAAVLVGSLVGFAAGDEPETAAPLVAAAELDRTPLPQGSDERGRAGVERSALALAAALDAVPVRADGDERTRYCEPSRLRVQWAPPLDGEFAVGGHVSPVGPAPDDTTTEVNGIVTCEGASYAYMGFEARWTGAQWSVASVPALSDEHGLEAVHEGESPAQGHDDAHDDAHDGDHDRDHARPAAPHAAAPHAAAPHAHASAARPPAQRPAPARRPSTGSRGFSVPAVQGIDRYASYDPQRVCDPVAKPGTLALRNLLLATYPGTRSLGISRTCTARGVSEHKEGRAFDWGVNVGVPRERAAAETVLRQLLATDAAGHRHALARRLGVMYVIWNRQIWSAYSADRGWRPYSGANAHTDHVHLSLSWDGAMGRTSYWQGANAPLLEVDPELVLAGGGTSSPTTGGGSTTGTSAPRDEDGDGPRPAKARKGRDEREEETEEPAGVDEVAAPRGNGKGKRRKHESDDALRVSYALAGAAQPMTEAAVADAPGEEVPVEEVPVEEVPVEQAPVEQAPAAPAPATAPGVAPPPGRPTEAARPNGSRHGTAQGGRGSDAPHRTKDGTRQGVATAEAAKARAAEVQAAKAEAKAEAAKAEVAKAKAAKAKAAKAKAAKAKAAKAKAARTKAAKAKAAEAKAAKAKAAKAKAARTKAAKARAGRVGTSERAGKAERSGSRRTSRASKG